MNVLHRLHNELWAILPSAVPALLQHFEFTLNALRNPIQTDAQRIAIEARSFGVSGQVASGEDWLSEYVVQRPAMSVGSDGVATIHTTGPLGRGLTRIEKRLGASDYDDIIADFDNATRDGKIKGIIHRVNSPGGSVVGIPETRIAIMAADAVKPVITEISTLGASAAYALSVAGSGIIASPSAIVGSIGTIATFADWSQFYEQHGVKIELITAKESTLKSTWHPLSPMTDEQRADAQRQLDSVNADFLSFVRARRPGIADASMRGQWFAASDAHPLKMVDQLGSVRSAHDAVHALIHFRAGSR